MFPSYTKKSTRVGSGCFKLVNLVIVTDLCLLSYSLEHTPNTTYFPLDSREQKRLHCFHCDKCFAPRNLIACSQKYTRCYFGHLISYEGDEFAQEQVLRRCYEQKTTRTEGCEDGFVIGKKLHSCICTSDACNSHTVIVGPSIYQRYYLIPKTLSSIDFPVEHSRTNSSQNRKGSTFLLYMCQSITFPLEMISNFMTKCRDIRGKHHTSEPHVAY